jgi:pyruvate dehydrogenase E2 component (dihydrolipoamide acetyltransferase)
LTGVQKLPDTVPAASPAASAEHTEVRLSNIRKVIARAMHQSLAVTAQLTLNASFDAANILAYRKALKAGGEALGLSNITLNDIVLFAAVKTLLKHPELNAHLLEDTMHVYSTVHLGIAVDTERGLMVPTLRHADRLSLNELAQQVKDLAKACQESSINPDLLKGATFTVTNLGALGIESFTPVLNPPQTGILGVNAIVYRQRESGTGFETYPAMGLSLTFDHRAVDGAPAARFLKDLKLYLENFSVLLAL